MKVREAAAFPCHAIEIRCLEGGRAKDTDVTVALIIGKMITTFGGRGVVSPLAAKLTSTPHKSSRTHVRVSLRNFMQRGTFYTRWL